MLMWEGYTRDQSCPSLRCTDADTHARPKQEGGLHPSPRTALFPACRVRERHSEDQAQVSGRAWSTGLLRAKRAVERLSSAGRRYLAREQLRGGGGVAVEVVIEPVPREEHLARRVERMALEVVDAE